MKSMIADKLKLEYRPGAILFSDNKPEGAHQFHKNKWGCAMTLYNIVMQIDLLGAWQGISGSHMHWTGEIDNFENDMPGTSNDPCAILNCGYMRPTDIIYINAYFLNGTYLRSITDASEWSIKVMPNNDSSLVLHDINTL